MTGMSQDPIFTLPNVNDTQALHAHQHAVIKKFADILGSIDAALRDALPKALNIFKLLDGKVDLAVHAPNTRYIVKQFLAKRRTSAQDEDDVSFNLQRVSNCGLCIQTEFGTVRVLKATNDGLPKAMSDARIRFSSSNQLVFQFGPDETPERTSSLNLFVMWTMDREYQYTGIEIACPRRTDKDGNIDCFWIAKWQGDLQKLLPAPVLAANQDLEEIKPIPAKDKQSEKA